MVFILLLLVTYSAVMFSYFLNYRNRDVDCSQCLHHLLFADNQVIAQDLDSVEYINAEDVAR